MVLQNKLGIGNPAELAQAEGRSSKQRAVELFDSGELESLVPGSYDSLASSH